MYYRDIKILKLQCFSTELYDSKFIILIMVAYPTNVVIQLRINISAICTWTKYALSVYPLGKLLMICTTLL